MKFYRGSPGAARSYVEADRSKVDDYYLAEGTGLAARLVAASSASFGPESGQVSVGGTLDGDAYEAWVGGYDPATGVAKGRLRADGQGLRFIEIVVNGPKSWSLAAALHPGVAAAYDSAQDLAAREIVGWLAEHATTRVGPRGRQVQVGVDQLEAAVVRHYTSRAGDPHRHLHLQINARVLAAGAWRGLHSVGVRDSIEAINGIGHAAVMTDTGFRAALAAHGYTLDPASGEVRELQPFVGVFSARAAQITRNTDRLEAAWRADHPGQEPGPKLRQGWDRRAWATARPDKVVPVDGADLARRWVEELHDAGYAPTTQQASAQEHARGNVLERNRHEWGPPLDGMDGDAVADLVVTRLGARRSAWNAADIRGEVERIIAATGAVATSAVRAELAEHLTTQTVEMCTALLGRDDVPHHVRGLTSPRVLQVEADLTTRFAARAHTAIRLHPIQELHPEWVETVARQRGLDGAQQRVVAALIGTRTLIVIEGAAGSGKTTTLAAAHHLLALQGRQLLVVTPTLKAARVATAELGAPAFTAAWLIHQHGYRWDTDGHHTRTPSHRSEQVADAQLGIGDVLLIDEAGMLDQDTAHALLTIANETGATIALVGDRHQLPAVGRGGVLDLAVRHSTPGTHLTLESAHRFTDADYADLTLLMRTGENPGHVFDTLLARGQIRIHPTEVERQATLTTLVAGLATRSGLLIADTREQVAALNVTIRDHRLTTGEVAPTAITTRAGVPLGVGDQVTTRRNDAELGVANRDRWTVTATAPDGTLTVHGHPGSRTLPPQYVAQHVELAYATTVYGAQGDTVDTAHLLIGETTGAAAAYVAMTRGRHHNTAHLVADTPREARTQWIDVFDRDRADLGPAHAAHAAAQDIERYGPQIAAPRSSLFPEPGPRVRDREAGRANHHTRERSPGIGY